MDDQRMDDPHEMSMTTYDGHDIEIVKFGEQSCEYRDAYMSRQGNTCQGKASYLFRFENFGEQRFLCQKHAEQINSVLDFLSDVQLIVASDS